jgi:hypothetical protein
VDYGWPLRAELFSGGNELAGPVRIEVGQESVPNQKVYPWPLAASPATYQVSLDNAMSLGQSTLVSDPNEVSALRNLRKSFVSDSEQITNFFGLILVEPKGFVLAIRDDVPFSGPNGVWSPP